MTLTARPVPLQAARTTLHIEGLRVGEDITVDEVSVEAAGLRVEPPREPGGPPVVRGDDATVRIVITEPNLNGIAAASIPPDKPVRNLRLEVHAGHIRVTAAYMGLKLVGVPVAVDAIPRIEAGVRIAFDWSALSAIGVPVPQQALRVIQQLVPPIDLSGLPAAVWLEEAVCEPGRVILRGLVRPDWPPAAVNAAGASRRAIE